VNSEVSGLYWSVGRDILDRQNRQDRQDRQDRLGWGGKVLDRLAVICGRRSRTSGLVTAQPHYMRAFAAAWPDREDLCTRLVHNAGQSRSRAVREYQIGRSLYQLVTEQTLALPGGSPA